MHCLDTDLPFDMILYVVIRCETLATCLTVLTLRSVKSVEKVFTSTGKPFYLSVMARTKVNGVENVRKRKIHVSVEEQLEEEEPKVRKVFKKNHVYHVSEWVPDTDTVSGEPAEGVPVKLKQIIRLETAAERQDRKAAYAEAKRMEHEKKLAFWSSTDHPMVEIRTQATGLNKVVTYAVSSNCLLGNPPYERIVKNPQVFVSCVEVTRKNATAGKKVYVVVGMVVELFSYPENPVLLHSIIMHKEDPHR